MRKGQSSPFMQTAIYFKTKYADEWNKKQEEFKAEKAKVIPTDAGQTVTITPPASEQLHE